MRFLGWLADNWGLFLFFYLLATPVMIGYGFGGWFGAFVGLLISLFFGFALVDGVVPRRGRRR